ncbi:carbonyl reductase [NADPH] 1-like isoform X1 [Montipora capricornis]|uniref:carbonyl reductase [NADPH] 1-like isoform X1 n=1 Tax=Montipora capricornis TaxID=246305 RepID=UPI0035F1A6C8
MSVTPDDEETLDDVCETPVVRYPSTSSPVREQRDSHVTGGNRGIGYAVVKRLSKEFNGVVIFTARDANIGTKVCEELSKELSATNIQFHPLDITSLESVRKLRDHVRDKFGGLDILINNAAVLLEQKEIPCTERAETTIKTNYFGTLEMCNSFFPLLRPHARVVNVSSQKASLSSVSPSLQKQFTSTASTIPEITTLIEKYLSDSRDGKMAEWEWPNDSHLPPAYRVSKIGIISLTMAQARQFEQDSQEGIIVNSVCPGWVRTDMGGPNGLRSPEEGADTIVYCALLPRGTTSPNGELVYKRKILQWTSGK